MATKEELQAYKHAIVAKVFPLYGTEPFKGMVKAVDTSGQDDKAFRIVYEDGDSEWITLEELKQIIVEDGGKEQPPRNERKRARAQKQASEEQQAADDEAAAGDRQQGRKKKKKQKQAKPVSQQQKQEDEQEAAAAAGAGWEATKTSKAAAEKAPVAAAAVAAPRQQQGEEVLDAERAKRQLRAQQQEQQGLPGMTSFTLTAGAARAAADKAAAGSSKGEEAAAAAAAAAAAGKIGAGPAAEQAGKPSTPAAAAAAAGALGKGAAKRAAGGGVSMSTADTQGLIASIQRDAAPTAVQLVHDRQVARMPYQGPGAAVLPAMSQVVVAGGHCYITLQSAPRTRPSTPGKDASQQPSSSAGAAGSPEYMAESAALLAELQRLLQHSGTDKRWLVKVRVTLRSMVEGLPGFQVAWNAWVARDSLPVMTLVEGTGPFKAAGVMLEATALLSA